MTNQIKQFDIGYFIILFLLALFIWLRNLIWVSSADDTLPVLIAIPIFIWLGSPWKFKDSLPHFATTSVIIAIVIFLTGIALNYTVLLAISWTLLLWTWLSPRLEHDSLHRVQKLLVLPLLAFPWITLDAEVIGWWFRLTGAWATGVFFSLIGIDVAQQGTDLVVEGIPMSVAAACSGINTLQSMLIAGTISAYLILGNTLIYWLAFPQLILLAWIANTLRIIVLASAALLWGPAFSMGLFHTWGGWFIIIGMFLLSWFLFALEETLVESA
ncbi:MAG: hypothetical protein Tsb0021_14700 [Chlamydiales bacterium]